MSARTRTFASFVAAYLAGELTDASFDRDVLELSDAPEWLSEPREAPQAEARR